MAALADRDVPPAYVLKFYLYRSLVRVSFTAPIWYLYILENGVTYAGLGTVMAVWWVGLVVFEVPTGYVGDRIGRRRSLLLAESTVAGLYVLMAFAEGLAAFAALFLAWAAATTFRSGTAGAWLYDTLKERLDEDEFTRIKGRADAYGLVSSGATAVAGGYLADVSMSLTWLVTAGAVSLAVPVVYTFPAGSRYTGEAGDGAAGEGASDDTFTVLDAVPLLREKFTRPPLRSFVLLFGLLAGAYWGVNFFWQPVTTGLGLDVDHLGWMYAGFTAIGAAASYRADWLREHVGVRSFFAAAPALLGVAFAAVAVEPLLAVPVFFLMEGVFRVANPLAAGFINDRVESVGRATVLSTAGMVRRLVVAPFQFGAGLLADVLSPTETIGLFGGLLVAGALGLVVLATPFDGPADAGGTAAGGD